MPRWGELEVDERVLAVLDALEQRRTAITMHPVYSQLSDVQAVRCFMEHHVFAVWDFMSLVAALRDALTCGRPPWRPVGSAEVRRFVNELAIGEESDEHPDGGYISHFELYLEAMAVAGADTGPIEAFLAGLERGEPVPTALHGCGAAPGATRFVERTWSLVESSDLASVVGSFAFGRESLIPAMFGSLRALGSRQPELGLFCWYLDRHIDLDGDEHTPLAFKLVVNVCGDDEDAWTRCRDAARISLDSREALWESVSTTIGGVRPSPAKVEFIDAR